jgi:hypothetical protein
VEFEIAEGAVPVQGPVAKCGETYTRCDIEDRGFGWDICSIRTAGVGISMME